MQPPKYLPLMAATPPEQDESSYGFLIRIANQNQILPSNRGQILGRNFASPFADDSEVAQRAWLTQTSPDWHRWRTAYLRAVDHRQTFQLFGQGWLHRWSLRLSRQQVCCECIRTTQRAHYLWDLTACCACPQHGTVLNDICPHCHQSLSPLRPSLEICRCKRFIWAHRSAVLADPILLGWCTWVQGSIRPECSAETLWPQPLRILFDGLSVEGATIVVLAFAGGKSTLQTAKLNSTAPWLTSEDMALHMTEGLQKLQRYLDSGAAGAYLETGGVRDLEDLATHGLNPHDRQRATWLLKRLRSRKVRPSVLLAMQRQQELFGL